MIKLFGRSSSPRSRLRILAAGGRLSPSQLRQAAEAALAFGDGAVAIGRNQTLSFPMLDAGRLEQCKHLLNLTHWRIEHPGQPADEAACLSTLPVHGLSSSTSWLTESIYEDAIEAVGVREGIVFNIADPRQPFFPRQLGDVQWMAADRASRWRPCVQPAPGEETAAAPFEIHSGALAEAAEAIARERIHLQSDPIAALLRLGAERTGRGWTRTHDPLTPAQPLLPIEGFLRQNGIASALGLVSQNFRFSAEFLVQAAVLAVSQPGIRIGITPWRGLVLRGIDEAAHGRTWRLLMAQHRECLGGSRHAGWFWIMPEDAEPHAALRMALIEDLDARLGPAADFSIEIAASPNRASASIVIVPQAAHRCDLYARESLSTGTGALHLCATGLATSALGAAIAKLAAPKANASSAESISMQSAAPERIACSDCLTEYLPQYGDPRAGIEPGTPFEAIDEAWQCPVCGAGKAAYSRGAFVD